ncbi:MAG: SDR family oxidoreductase [Acidimicrobiales bacterium]
MADGACVVGIDVSPSVVDVSGAPGWVGVVGDVTDADVQRGALRAAVESFGGIDLAVVSAGIFGASAPIAALDPDEWRRVLGLNLDASVQLLAALHRAAAPLAGGAGRSW